MKEIVKKYFGNLGEAENFAKEKRAEIRKQYDCYFDCSVWDAANDTHFENGIYMRYVVIACIWPDFIVK